MTSTSLLDHILTNSSERVSQSGEANVGLSNHQMIYCTRKITHLKHNTPKFVKTRSFKNYSSYSDFIGKLTTITDKIAPVRRMNIKTNSQEWFDEEIHKHIALHDKMLAKFKKSRKE